MSPTRAQRQAWGRLGAHTALANHGGEKLTAAARAAFLDRFEKQVDPDGVLDPAERSKRAEFARKAYFQRLALKSAETRRMNKIVSTASTSDRQQTTKPTVESSSSSAVSPGAAGEDTQAA